MPIILFTSHNEASANIAKRLIEGHGFAKQETGNGKLCWERGGVRMIDTLAPSILEVPADFSTDLLLVLSTHKSAKGGPSLTVHVPGNWDRADMGGLPRTLNVAHAGMMKALLRELDAINRERLGWPLSLETDHHGPTCGVPIIFVEIGSTEKEWKDEAAGAVVAEAVSNALTKNKPRNKNQNENKNGTENPKLETVFGCGGGHYAREFTKIVLEDDGIAVGHMCPKYAMDSLAEDTFRQAIERNVSPVKRVVALKDGMNAAQKAKVKALCDTSGVEYSES